MALLTLKAGIGGGNKIAVFTMANTTTVATTAAFTFDRVESSGSSGYPTRGNLVFDIVNKIDNQGLHEHLNTYMSGASPVKEITQDYENGDNSTVKQAVTAADKLFFIHYSGIDADAKRKVTYGCFVYSGDTGNQAYAKDGVNGVTVQITAVESTAEVTMPSSCLDTAYVTGYGADFTVSANTNSVITHLTAA